MTRKYELIEVDGNFGLLVGDLETAKNCSMNVYKIDIYFGTGQIMKIHNPLRLRISSDHRKNKDNMFLVCKEKYECEKGTSFVPAGITRYFGQRLSLAEYEQYTIPQFEFIMNVIFSSQDKSYTNYIASVPGFLINFVNKSYEDLIRLEALEEKARGYSEEYDKLLLGFRDTLSYFRGRYVKSVSDLEKMIQEAEQKKKRCLLSERKEQTFLIKKCLRKENHDEKTYCCSPGCSYFYITRRSTCSIRGYCSGTDYCGNHSNAG